MVTRRNLLGAGAAMALLKAGSAAAGPGSFGGEPLARAIADIEAALGGRLGVGVLDTHTGARFDRRGDERFPVASTFKLVLAAAVLARVDRGSERLDRRIAVREGDLVPYAPVTGKHVGDDGLTVAELCEAIIVWSDNPAANLLLATMGGPAGLTAFAREMGDEQFRLDRIEPALNEAIPGDPRDTSTPVAMVDTMNRLHVGDALSPASRTRLTDWLIACRTGDRRIRGGLPEGWRCGDKTGTGEHGTANDVAIVWPPGRAPLLVAAYLTGTSAAPEARDAALASVGRAVAAALG